ncbi:MAG: hypothetical protein WBO29_00855 [Albidovulum sp.]
MRRRQRVIHQGRQRKQVNEVTDLGTATDMGIAMQAYKIADLAGSFDIRKIANPQVFSDPRALANYNMMAGFKVWPDIRTFVEHGMRADIRARSQTKRRRAGLDTWMTDNAKITDAAIVADLDIAMDTDGMPKVDIAPDLGGWVNFRCHGHFPIACFCFRSHMHCPAVNSIEVQTGLAAHASLADARVWQQKTCAAWSRSLSAGSGP